MALSQDYIEFIKDQLSEFGEFEMKKMFGGIGIFREGKMFAMIGGDKLRLKVDDNNKQDFIVKGMEPYQDPKKKKGMPYWKVPADVLEDKTQLAAWANKAYAAAVAGKK